MHCGVPGQCRPTPLLKRPHCPIARTRTRRKSLDAGDRRAEQICLEGASRMNQLGNTGSAASTKAQGSASGRLPNRVALVTGPSRGLGRFFAETLAREGAHVILANRSDVPEITERIARAGGKANFVEMDVTRDDSILGAFEHIVTQWGPPSVVVNNAGITDVADTLKEDPAEFDRVISTNLRGPWMIAREAARHLVAA